MPGQSTRLESDTDQRAAAKSAMQARRNRILELLDVSKGTGLEIGPLHQPLALRSESDVRYVDIFSGEQLREHYADDPNVPTENIPDMDFVLSGPDGIATLSEAAGPGAPYDWVVASHVIEHVPDLIGWLSEIAELTADGAHLLLAIPDRRFTFDAHRPQTTIGQILQAHEDRDMTPSVRAVYDHFSRVITVSPVDAWQANLPGREARLYDLTGTMQQVRLARDEGRYIDSHVWLFTPSVFVDQIVELGQLDQCEFVVDSVEHTRLNELEFYAVLRRLPRGLSDKQKRIDLATGLQSFDDVDVAAPMTLNGTDEPAPFRITDREQKLIETKRAVLTRTKAAASKVRHARAKQ